MAERPRVRRTRRRRAVAAALAALATLIAGAVVTGSPAVAAVTGTGGGRIAGPKPKPRAHTARRRLVGCKPRKPDQWFNGSRHAHRVVAMTFDDGPNPPYTQQILAILRRNHVHATFFLIGQQIRRNAALVRQELAQGNIVGDHTWNHANVSGGGSAAASQIRSTAGVIHAVTGFRPCLFRPPYGATSGRLARLAWSMGFNTIIWDVDPRDWSRPGTGAIYSNVVGHARPGSIILDHDGGGNRSQTVAALPRIIHTLRARHYRFITLPQLLGQRLIYR